MGKIEEKADGAIRDNEETWPSGILYPVHSHSTSAPLRPELWGFWL